MFPFPKNFKAYFFAVYLYSNLNNKKIKWDKKRNKKDKNIHSICFRANNNKINTNNEYIYIYIYIYLIIKSIKKL
jgi:hypothetical protein